MWWKANFVGLTSPFTKWGPVSNTGVELQFWNFRCNHFARNEGRTNGKSLCKRVIFKVKTEMLKIAVKLQSWNIRRNLFARHESRASKTGVKLQFWNFRWDHIARDEGRTNGKNWCKLAILQRQTEINVGNCCNLQSWNIRCNLSARHEGRTSKTGVKLHFWNFRCNLFTQIKIGRQKLVSNCRYEISDANPAQHQGQTAKTAVKLLFCNVTIPLWQGFFV